MEFGFYPVAPVLALAVKAIWFARGTRDEFDTPEAIVPDGCVEIVLNLGDRFMQIDGGRVPQPRDLLVGQMTRPTVAAPTGAVDLIGIRLWPSRGGAVLRTPMWELRDRLISASDVIPDLRQLVEELRTVSASEEKAGLKTRLHFLTRALAPHCARVAPRRLQGVEHALRQIAARRGAVGIDAVARSCGVSRRHLEREFRDQVGLGPKHMARIARVQAVLKLLNAPQTAALERRPALSALPGAEIASHCGYTDQAHMIHEFRALTGTTPTRLTSSAHSLSGLMREEAAAR